MRRGLAFGVALLVMTLTASCSGSQHPAAAGNAGAAPAAPAASSSGPPALSTTVQYSGVYDEKIHEDYSGDQLIKSEDKHSHFTFSETVSLTTPRGRLATPITGTSPISDSLTNKVSFQLSGMLSDKATPDVANGPSCDATLSGVNGVAYSTSSTNIPPVQIMIAALNPDGSQSKTYLINIAATVPDFSAGLGGRAELGGVVRRKLTSGQDGPNFCNDELANGGVMVKDPKCADLWHPGPRETAPGEPPYLSLPLDTTNYSKNYSCDYTDPISSPGTTGTDVITASGTLTVNATGTTYAALGDSYSSGDFPPYQDQPCGRSQGAYPALYQTDPARLAFLACLGASSAKIEATQVPQIPATTKIVSVTAGGDDFVIAGGNGPQGLVAPLLVCIQQHNVPIVHIPCGQKVANDLLSQMPTVESNVEHMLNAVKDKVDNVKVFVLGYPNAFPVRFNSGSCPGLEETNRTLHDVFPLAPSLALQGVAAWDVGVFHDLITVLNQAVARAASSAGATYIDPTTAFAGHDLCAPDPWFFPLGDHNFTEALHPNDMGHQQLAQLLNEAAGPASQ